MSKEGNKMPMTLNDYVADVQTFLSDSNQEMLDPQDIIKYVNRARPRDRLAHAMHSRADADHGGGHWRFGCSGGSGYSSSPTITLTAPDFPSGQGP